MNTKTPTWAIVVGILMMLFGGCDGIASALQTRTRDGLNFQQEMIERLDSSPYVENGNFEKYFSDSLRSDSATIKSLEHFKKMSESMGEMMKVSEYTVKWLERFAYIGLFIALLYIIGGVFLMIRRPFSITLATVVLLIDILFIITQAIVLGLDSESSNMSQLASTVPLYGIVIDLVFLIVIRTSDRSSYIPTPNLTYE